VRLDGGVYSSDDEADDDGSDDESVAPKEEVVYAKVNLSCQCSNSLIVWSLSTTFLYMSHIYIFFCAFSLSLYHILRPSSNYIAHFRLIEPIRARK